jgi:MFS family permease
MPHRGPSAFASEYHSEAGGARDLDRSIEQRAPKFYDVSDMIEPVTGPKRVVAASAMGLAFGYSSIGIGSFGVFVVPLTKRFGWGRGDMSLALTLMSVAVIILSPVAGSLLDRYGVRRVLIPSTMLFGFVIASMSLMAGSLGQFYFMYLLIAMTGVCTTPASYSRVIVAWFDRRRGLALGVVLAGIGLGSAFTPLFVGTVTTRLGWRIAYVGLGLLVLLVSLPAIVAWVREPVRVATDHASIESGINFSAAIRTRPFALMIVSFALLGIFTGGIVSHLVPMLADRGVGVDAAVGIASLLGFALIAGRIMTGFLLDHFFAPLVIATFLLAPISGVSLMLMGATGGMALIAVVLMGLGVGAEMDFMSYLVSRYFGLICFGRIYGLTYAALTAGISLGPLFMGYSQQVTGSYTLGLSGLLASCALAVIPFLFLGGYPVLSRESATA